MELSWRKACQSLPAQFPPETAVAVLEYPDEVSWRWVYRHAELKELGCDSLADYSAGLLEYVLAIRRRGGRVLVVPFVLVEYQEWLDRENRENSEPTRQIYAARVGETIALRKLAKDESILPETGLGFAQPDRASSDFWTVHFWEPAFLSRPDLEFRGTFSRQQSEVADVAILNLTLHVTPIDRAKPTQHALRIVWQRCANLIYDRINQSADEPRSEGEVLVKDEFQVVPEFLCFPFVGVFHTVWPRFLLIEKGVFPSQWPDRLILHKQRLLLPFDAGRNYLPALREALEFEKWMNGCP